MDARALHKIQYGMYVVSGKAGGRMNGQIANTVFQVTSEPPTIAVSIAKANYTHEIIIEGRAFTVSVLSEATPFEFIGTFGFKCGRTVDKFASCRYKQGVTGAPVVLDHAVAYLEAELLSSVDLGTHTLFIGKIVEAEILNDEPPMTYEYYHRVKRGKAPKTAPTYITEKKPAAKEEVVMRKYRCTVCGYIYDPALGDPDSGVQPGTAFEQIPDTWVCPVCGAPKSAFEPAE